MFLYLCLLSNQGLLYGLCVLKKLPLFPLLTKCLNAKWHKYLLKVFSPHDSRCYKCNSGVQVNASKKLRTLVDHVQGHFDKAPRTLPVISTVAIPLGPPPPPLPIDKKQETSTNNSRNFKKKGTNGKQTVTPQPCKIRVSNLGILK